MVKHRVLGFFSWLILLILVLVVIQVAAFGKMTGFNVAEDSVNLKKEGLSLRVDSMDLRNALVSVDYILFVDSLESQKVKVAYSVFDLNNQEVKSGEKEVVVEPNKDNFYSLNIFVSDAFYEGSITISAIGNGKVVYDNFPIEKKRLLLTGNSIRSSSSQSALSYLGLILIGVFVVSYILWYVSNKRRVGYLAESVGGRYIHLKDI
ncbi:hypothetical protein COU54_00920 [Candidatus Pacearchaeota archaeon CG10_big_fil_rev_8_21_14_0_10_31_24]|nr:MAG: hypothetical protein COU54_00920 [Candidatus Pacearchaeota archaeon CG10_big_fil_rev_8_21_14_0_10_31_24]